MRSRNSIFLLNENKDSQEDKSALLNSVFCAWSLFRGLLWLGTHSSCSGTQQPLEPTQFPQCSCKSKDNQRLQRVPLLSACFHVVFWTAAIICPSIQTLCCGMSNNESCMNLVLLYPKWRPIHILVPISHFHCRHRYQMIMPVMTTTADSDTTTRAVTQDRDFFESAKEIGH